MVKSTPEVAKNAWRTEVENAFKLSKTSEMVNGFLIEGIYDLYSLEDIDGNPITKVGKLENINEHIEKMVQDNKYPLPNFTLERMTTPEPKKKYIVVIHSEEFE